VKVATPLYNFINNEVLPGTGIDQAGFWKGFDTIVAELAPKNAALLAERDRIQLEMDAWHKANPGPIANMAAYQEFLKKIGYLVEQPAKVQATTANVDSELATQAGPQLVVPILNARYALNAANARWGPLEGASHKDATGYAVAGGKLQVNLKNGSTAGLKNAAQLVGYQGEAAAPSSVLLVNNGIHADIIINRSTPIGSSDAAGVADVVLEAALSTILDLEDSVAAVDAEDKSVAYKNWLGILKGTLTESKREQRRQNLYTWFECGPRVHRREWRESDHAWPQYVVPAQCGPLDDQPRHSVGRRQRNS